jgi:hypothetical protein
MWLTDRLTDRPPACFIRIIAGVGFSVRGICFFFTRVWWAFSFLFLGFESHKVLDLLVCAGQWFLLLLDSRFGWTGFVWGCALESLRRRLRIVGFYFWGCKRNFFLIDISSSLSGNLKQRVWAIWSLWWLTSVGRLGYEGVQSASCRDEAFERLLCQVWA